MKSKRGRRKIKERKAKVFNLQQIEYWVNKTVFRWAVKLRNIFVEGRGIQVLSCDYVYEYSLYGAHNT